MINCWAWGGEGEKEERDKQFCISPNRWAALSWIGAGTEFRKSLTAGWRTLIECAWGTIMRDYYLRILWDSPFPSYSTAHTDCFCVAPKVLLKGLSVQRALRVIFHPRPRRWYLCLAYSIWKWDGFFPLWFGGSNNSGRISLGTYYGIQAQYPSPRIAIYILVWIYFFLSSPTESRFWLWSKPRPFSNLGSA